ncbi:3-phosphoshikimate 1-carboxyvinyltransferase [Arachidicoccus ginsenosidimutans]|uniref:3-phosphoshikimate 1-carboxyvinyltransferase n=1 Tax=Arachidicoccus sp. BS20 TaxID=1850526 RepID=UPI0007F10FD5|nr:3-phosphoshikimate 1-carboxyvinyltransferase [Arachidicoccus sp. BS20]ANI87948.1 3-phosphoshikimate 1-carboxyvinyltransferase [Arachidicoccus sp. BS20]
MQTNILVPNVITIHPSKIYGSIVAPASKSSMQRACAAALVRKGISIIHNPGVSNDDIASLNVIQTLGAKVEQLEDGSLKIDSTNIELQDEIAINFGESGLGTRMFTPIAATTSSTVNITGEGSILSRPMDFFDEILPQLNVEISSNDGKLPLKIKGPLQPKNITIEGSLSSQFLTGLLLAFAASLNPSEGGTLKDDENNSVTISVKNLKSKPYIDLTLKVMKDFELNVPENKNYNDFVFSNSRFTTHDSRIDYTVEGDWSGGAFLLVAGAIAGGITVSGLDIHSTQADKKILEALQDCSCQLSIQEKQIEVAPAKLKAFQFDANDCPDLFPPLVALASYCEGTTVIEGVERLTHKESNRALTLQEEFAKLGIAIVLQDNLMLVKGGTGVHSAVTHSRHDHRIAMACAVAALRASGEVTIEEATAVKKSYPNFYNHLEQLGVTLSS